MTLMELHVEVPDGCLSDLRFDEWATGELPEPDAAALAAHVGACARCAARRVARDGQASAFLSRRDASGIRQRARGPRSRGLWMAAGGAALAAAAALVLVQVAATSGGERTKGGPQIGFFVKRGDAVFEGQNGQRVRAGDRLRFVVSTPDQRYLTVLGRDSTGMVSSYYPTAGLPERVGPGRQLVLGSSVELDEAPGTERIFALFCAGPTDGAKLLEELRKRGSIESSWSCAVDVIELIKEVAP